MNQEILEKIKKIKALAERGVGGEAENAESLLATLLKKYDIREEELEEEVVKEYKFYCYGQFGIELFYQICHAVNPDRDVLHYRFKRSDCKTRFVNCTAAEFMEISEMFEFYRYHLDEGIKRYFRAFIQAEHIFPDYDKHPELLDDSTLTAEDVEMLKLAANMDKHERLLKLEDGSSK